MAEQLIPRITMAEQIIKLPEELHFPAVKQTRELMANKKFMEEQIKKLKRELAQMSFVFRATPKVPLIPLKKLIEETPYVSQTTEEFGARVLRKTVSKGIFLVVLLIVVKFVAAYRYTMILEQASNFVTEHFLMAVGAILAGCAVLSAIEVSYRDSVNSSELKRINDESIIDNRKRDRQNAESQQENLRRENEDEKRRAEEERNYQIKRREVQKLLVSYEKAHQEVLADIAQLRERNVMPRMFFEDGNEMLPVVYDIMQTRVATKLYDWDGAMEKARIRLQEERMMAAVHQIEVNTSQAAKHLNELNKGIRGVHEKLDSLDGRLSSLVISQNQLNAMLGDVCRSSQDIVEAVKDQRSALERHSYDLAAQNKMLASSIDKSIRENSLGKYVYDPSLFGTWINAKEIKKAVEGRS